MITLKRTRTSQPVIFGTALVGPSGAALVGYEWKYTTEEEVIGDEVAEIRVSDWDQAETNVETGRDIVHLFHVETMAGRKVVSLETALALLGYGNRDGKAVKALASAAKTLAGLRLQLELILTQEEAVRLAKAEADRLPLPPLECEAAPLERLGRRVLWQMGDVIQYVLDGREIPSQEAMANRWRWQRCYELCGLSSFAVSGLASRRADLERRIARAETKLTG